MRRLRAPTFGPKCGSYLTKTIEQNPSGRVGQAIALVGLILYAAFAPHSVAASATAVCIAGVGWILRSLSTRSLGLQPTRFDLVIVLLIVWTVLSAVFSAEPEISMAKIHASWCVLAFYLARAVVTRRTAPLLVSILILSAAVGALYSAYDLLRGRGVVVESISPDSPFRQLNIQPGDTIWRIGNRRVYSQEDLDDVLKNLPIDAVSVSVISDGEHVERLGLFVPAAIQRAASPSGVVGTERNHRFRASGWTRHYDTFAEVLQMVAQLALGLALAHLCNHGANRYFKIALAATLLVSLGIVLTAMRTVIVAFVVAAFMIAWRSTRGAAKIAVTFALFFLIAFGAVVIWRTRAPGALLLGDASSSLRVEVARVGLSRILLHPVFGHGMDAMHKHWNEWGFPGSDMLHLHSTPLQLAFDRGLPTLAFWLWLMVLFWLHVDRAQSHAADSSDTNRYGILLGIEGALIGFLLSSLVNYNYGDSEVVMLFWWLMGVGLVLAGTSRDTGTGRRGDGETLGRGDSSCICFRSLARVTIPHYVTSPTNRSRTLLLPLH